MLGQRIHGRTDLTYVEDLKDPDEVQFPTRDLILIAPRIEYSWHRSSFTLLGDLVLDGGHGSAIEGSVGETLRASLIQLT